MRRAGKTTFLRQLQAERRLSLPAERTLFLSFDDDRLGGIEADQLGFLLEEYYRRHPASRGRGIATVIRPFSFREYLLEGGFPEAQGLAAPLRIELLQGYVDTVLFRDVVERHGVSQVTALRWLVRQCLRNPAGSFSVHRLHRDLKSAT